MIDLFSNLCIIREELKKKAVKMIEQLNISATAIHYIFLDCCKSKAKMPQRRLTFAINKFHKKFNGLKSPSFITLDDCTASKAQLRVAYIEDAVNTLVRTGHKYGTPKIALEIIAASRHIPLEDLVRANLARQWV